MKILRHFKLRITKRLVNPIVRTLNPTKIPKNIFIPNLPYFVRGLWYFIQGSAIESENVSKAELILSIAASTLANVVLSVSEL